MRKLILLAALLTYASPALAQTPVVGTEHVAWDQPAASLAEAQALTYSPLIDASAAPAQLAPFAGVVCSGQVSPFLCQVRLPALTTGLHQLRVVAATTVNGTVLSSNPSAPLALLIMAIPAVPQNVRLMSGQ